MYTILILVHIIACALLITVVLLQTGKGSDIGAVFGGSSQTIFGSAGAGTLLTKLTAGIAVIFMVTSLTLTYGVTRQPSRSVFEDMPISGPPPMTSPQEAVPGQPGIGEEGEETSLAPGTGEVAPSVVE